MLFSLLQKTLHTGMPNVGAHLLPKAGAERTLEAVRCSAWLALRR